MKYLDLLEVYRFDLRFLVVSRFVPKLRRFKKNRAVNTFLTGSTNLQYSKVAAHALADTTGTSCLKILDRSDIAKLP